MPDTTPSTDVTVEQQIQSVFDTGYTSTTKNADYTKATTAYFCLGDVLDALTNSRASSTGNTDPSPANNFWQIIVTDLTSSFSEKYSVHNTVSESVALFATGTAPIEIGITGKLLVTQNEDYRFDFLKRYITEFRFKRLSQDQKHLTFVSQDTQFCMLVQTIVLGDNSASETYTDISIQGYGYKFKMVNSQEPVSYGYYGSESGVATQGSSPEGNQDATQQVPNDPEINKVPTATNNNAKDIQQQQTKDANQAAAKQKAATPQVAENTTPQPFISPTMA